MTKSPYKPLSLIVAMLLLLVNSFTLYGAEAGTPPSETIPVTVPKPASTIENVSTAEDSLVTINDTLTVVKAKQDSLSYAADSIAFNYNTEQIYLYGNTNIKYQNSIISADSLQIDLKKDRAFSSGRTVMQDNEQILIGKQVFYDVNSRMGMMYNGSSKFDKGYYYGEELRRINDNIYDVDGGRFTTCDDPSPDFWFWSKKMRMYRNDKVVGKPVVFYVNHVPIFYFPFMTFSIKRGRQQGFLIPEPGYNNVDGKYVKNIAYFYPYKDYADATASLDLMERTGWQLNLETRYLQRYKYNGNFNMSYRNRIDDLTTYRDYAINGNHHQELAEKAAFDVNIDYVSNKRIWENSNNIDQSLAQRVYSSMSYRKPLLSTYLNAGATYTQDLINNTVSLTLPSASYSLPTRPVYEIFTKNDDKPVKNTWWSNFNYSYNVRLDHTGNIREKHRTLQDLIWDNTYDSTGVVFVNEHHAGIKHSASINYNYKLLGWLNLTQSFNYDEAWMDRDKNGVKWVRANDYSTGTNANFTMYGLKKIPNFYVSAVRHIVTPSAGFSYNPDYSDNDKYYYFGGVGVISGNDSRIISLGLDQKWQIKLAPKGELKERKLNDFLGWTTRSTVDLEKDKKQFSALSHYITVRPAQLQIGSTKLTYSTSYSATQNPYEQHILDWKLHNQYLTHSIAVSGNATYTDYFPRTKNESFAAYLPKEDSLGINTALPATETGSESWSFGISQDFSADHNIIHPRSNNIRMNAAMKLTTNWSMNYSNYYDYTHGQMISQSIDVSRLLHCWKLDISYTRRNEYWDYRIVFYNIQLPDALKFQTRDSRHY